MHEFLNFPTIKAFIEEDDKKRQSYIENTNTKHLLKTEKLTDYNSYNNEEKIKINEKEGKKEI